MHWLGDCLDLMLLGCTSKLVLHIHASHAMCPPSSGTCPLPSPLPACSWEAPVCSVQWEDVVGHRRLVATVDLSRSPGGHHCTGPSKALTLFGPKWGCPEGKISGIQP